jgi:gliding motility-associated-like protein
VPALDCEIFEVKNEIYIPNVFSPNGDGINDFFTVSFGPDLEVTEITGSIFDRWGNLVFSSDAIPFAWDGAFDGEPVQPGVFVYTVKVTYMVDVIEKAKILKGDVTVIK